MFRRLAVTPLLLSVLALAALVPAASAQQGTEAGKNEFFFHGQPPAQQPTFDGEEPQGSVPDVQMTEPVANEDFPENPLAAFWTGDFQAGAIDKDMVLRWYFSSPNATGTLFGVDATVTVFALPETGDARIIGRAEVPLVVGATPTLNESVVRVEGTLAAGERLTIQVVPVFLDTGTELNVTYDSASNPSGFLFRDPAPTEKLGVDGLASADARGLAFSATVPADPQRDEAEALIEIDDDGNMYTCGPTGVSGGADYAQVSTDGGNQFHLLGEPPRGQQSEGGGGDCGLATSPDRNAKGNFNYAFTGLGPLTNFVTAASDNVGESLRSSPVSESFPGVDRQWNTFVDEDSVLLSYNNLVPRQVAVQRSDDGGVNYGLRTSATSTNPSFPGPMRALPAQFNPDGEDAGRVAYFGWNRDNQIFLAASKDGGATWFNCKVQKAPGEPSLFVTVDHDRAGNIYVAYSENTTFHTFVSVLPINKLGTCLEDEGKVDPIPGRQTQSTPVQAEVSKPIQVDRDAVRTSLFSWVTAGGAPGRFAVSFYGSETDGDPAVGPGEDEDGNPIGFRGTWDVYVSQTTDALAADPQVGQVKATTHPFHYDSICLNGLGCDITGGDRSLADFFASDFNPRTHAVNVVYNQAFKRPGDESGSNIASPVVISQIGGPTLDAKPLAAPQGRPLDNDENDPGGDAIDDYSRTCPQSTVCPPRDPTRRNQPAADIERVEVGPEVDPESGKAVANGGFTVTMKVADLSDGALEQTLAESRMTRLIYIFRWFNGFRPAAAVARFTPEGGFTFGFNGFATGTISCGSLGEKCLTYPGDEEIAGRVDQKAGTIVLSVPREKLMALSGPTGPNQRPEEVPAGDESRFYDGTAFSLGQTTLRTIDPSEQSFLYPFDNAPAFDFLTGGRLPASAGAGGDGGQGGPGGGAGGGTAPDGGGGGEQPGDTACTATAAFRSAGARPRRRRVAFTFMRRSQRPVQVDVFQTSRGRRVLGERLVARFTGRRKSFVWNGKANRPGRRVTDGIYFVRFRTRGSKGKRDVLRTVLQRRNGRWRSRPDHHGRSACGLLRLHKLERPVFGGRFNQAIDVSIRLNREARVTIDVMRGNRLVKRYKPRNVRALRTFRRRFDSEGRRRGDYRFRITAVRGDTRTVRTLVSRRL